MLDRKTRDHLHAIPKVIPEPLCWEPCANGKYRIDVDVYSPDYDGTLHLSCNLGRTNFGFSLLCQNYIVRRYDNAPKHWLVGREKQHIRKPHKHTRDPENEDDDEEYYIPADIDPHASIDEQLRAFLREENIQLKRGYQPVLISE